MPAPIADSPTREKILQTAQRLFHQHGYSDVGINTLCSEAGVVKGSFYHFFPSKQALLEAVMERNQQAVENAFRQSSMAGGNGRERLLAHFSALIANATREKADGGRILGCATGTLASELAAVNEAARVTSAGAFRTWRQQLENLLRQGVEDGSIAQTVDPPSTSLSLLAVIQGMSVLGRCFNQPEMLTDIAQTTLKRLLPVRAQ